MELNGKSTLGEWASTSPGASAVFIKNSFDFCYKGSQSLEESCKAKGVAVEKVIEQIKEYSKGKDLLTWNSLELEQMIDKILERFHHKHRQDLTILIPLARKVESAHMDNKYSPQGLAFFLEKLLFELESHMKKEEQILFPLIKSGQGQMSLGPINMMIYEHVGHGENLAQLKALAKNYKLPENACESWVTLYQGVSTLEREIMEHIAIENNVLFPKALNG